MAASCIYGASADELRAFYSTVQQIFFPFAMALLVSPGT